MSMPAGGAAVEVVHLRKTYGALVAVDDVSFSVAKDEIFGIPGPNGAGKTTTVECITGLRRPDAGSVRVLGLDPQVDGAELHEVVGVQLQSSELQGALRVREILDLYRSFSGFQRVAHFRSVPDGGGGGEPPVRLLGADHRSLRICPNLSRLCSHWSGVLDNAQ